VGGGEWLLIGVGCGVGRSLLLIVRPGKEGVPGKEGRAARGTPT
jgi:hypothetical protein